MAIERLIFGRHHRHILHSMPLGGGGWDCSAGSVLLYIYRSAGLAYYDQCISHEEFLTPSLTYIIFYHIGMDIPGSKLITLSGTC